MLQRRQGPNCQEGEEGEGGRERGAPLSSAPPPSQPESPQLWGRWRRMVEEAERWVEEARWLEEVGRSPSLSPTWQLAPDGCRGRAMCFGGGASCKEALPYYGRQSPPEGIPQGWEGKEDQEVTGLAQLLFERSGSSKRALSSSLGNSFLTASPWDSPSSGQNRYLLPREHHYMLAGGSRSISGWSHGRCQPLYHTH